MVRRKHRCNGKRRRDRILHARVDKFGLTEIKIVETYHLSRNAIFELLNELRADLKPVTKCSHVRGIIYLDPDNFLITKGCFNLLLYCRQRYLLCRAPTCFIRWSVVEWQFLLRPSVDILPSSFYFISGLFSLGHVSNYCTGVLPNCVPSGYAEVPLLAFAYVFICLLQSFELHFPFPATLLSHTLHVDSW